MAVPANRLQVVHAMRAAVRPIAPVVDVQAARLLAPGAPPFVLFERDSRMDLVHLLNQVLQREPLHGARGRSDQFIAIERADVHA